MSHLTRPQPGLLPPTASSKQNESRTICSNTQKQHATRQPVAQAKDDLLCEYFIKCDGCSLHSGLHAPPVVDTARQFLAARGFQGFQTVPGPVNGWRCRARLAVRGSAGAPVIGLFQAGSHHVASITECRAHHPRINEAVQLLQQVAAALRIQPYQEQQQQQQHGASSSTSARPPTTSSSKQQQGQRRAPAAGNHSSSNSSSSRQQRGFLRYLQLTAVSSSPGGQAEDDPAAQIQLVLVWAAPDASHPSVADARRLAAALWSRAGPKEASPLAVLRARAEAKAAAAPGRPGSSKLAASRQKQRPTAGPAAGSSRSSSSTIQSASGRQQQQQQGQSQTPPLLHSILLNFQPAEGSNRIVGDSWLLLHGPPVGWQQFGGAALALAPGSFVQANYGAMQRCLAAIAAATPPGASVLELYAGSGVIGLALAAAGRARRVACVEVNPESAAAFEAARDQLAARDPAAAAVVSHHVGSAGDAVLVRRLLAASGAELMVVDPPRKGLDAPLLQLLTEATASSGTGSSGGSERGAAAERGALLGSTAEQSGGQQQQQQVPHHSSHLRRLIYLSCGFEALMRDCDALLTAGWRLSSCVAFFFFPGTDSIETLAVFEREQKG